MYLQELSRFLVYGTQRFTHTRLPGEGSLLYQHDASLNGDRFDNRYIKPNVLHEQIQKSIYQILPRNHKKICYLRKPFSLRPLSDESIVFSLNYFTWVITKC